MQRADGESGLARGAPGAAGSARCEGLNLTYLLLRWIKKLNAGIITGVEPGLQGLWLAGGALFDLKDCFVRGFHPNVRNTLDGGDQMRLVVLENCDEGEIAGIRQLEYVGARGKHFPGNLDGVVHSQNRCPI